MTRPRYNQKINLTIQKLGINGEGVGHWHGYRVFVDGALPQEVITARVKEKNQTYGKAKLESLLNASSDRVTPMCPHYSECGGCQLQHLCYQKQLEYKKEQVEIAFAKFCCEAAVEECEKAPFQMGYRNKAIFPVIEHERKSLFGLYARESHDVVPLNSCPLHLPVIEAAFCKIRPLLEELKPYNPDDGSGLLRYVSFKASRKNELLAILVLAQKKELLAFAEGLMQCATEIKGVRANINSEAGNQVFTEQFAPMAGNSFIEEELNGLKFKISESSFFQVNPWQAEKIYAYAIELADIKKDEIVLDAFCGTGVLALFAAQKAKEAIGVESVLGAVRDAQENAQINGISNVVFHHGLAEEFIKEQKKIDLLFLNPPRKGVEPSFLEALSGIDIKKIIYISCNPASLAKDSKRLLELGFAIDLIKPFDMFPNSYHVETVVKFHKI